MREGRGYSWGELAACDWRLDLRDDVGTCKGEELARFFDVHGMERTAIPFHTERASSAFVAFMATLYML